MTTRWRRLLLPAAAEGLVELHQRNQFVALGLCQSQFGGEVISFVGQHLEITAFTGFVANLGKTGRILRGLRQQFLLLPKLPVLAIANQGVGNIAKRTLNRLLVEEHRLIPLCLRQVKIGGESSSLKDGLSERSSHAPQS